LIKVALVQAALPLVFGAFLVSVIWGKANHRWRLKPWKPMAWAGLLMFSMLALWLAAEINGVEVDPTIEKGSAPVWIKAFLAGVAKGNLLIQKIVELLGLPVVVGLVLLAFTFKVDAEKDAWIARVQARQDTASEAEAQLDKLSSEMDRLLDLPSYQALGQLAATKRKLDAGWRLYRRALDDLRDEMK